MTDAKRMIVPGWVSTLAISILLAALTVSAYWPVLSCGFVNLDDGEYVYSNGAVKQGLSTSGWIYAWSNLDLMNWHPLTWLSLQLDSSLWGTQAAGYHLTNLIFHTVNVVLLFVVLKMMTGFTGRSASVAALFAIHPLHVESVAWISERKDVLSTFFLLLTLLMYAVYARRPTFVRYLGVFLFFTMGLLSKPMLVTLPILLILIDFWPLQRIIVQTPRPETSTPPQVTFQYAIVEKLPLFCLSFVDGIITVIAQRGATLRIDDLPLYAQFANVFSAGCWYLQKTFVPTDLIAFYPHAGRDVDWPRVAVGIILFVSLTTWSIWRRHSRPHILFGWGWFIVSLLPVIGLLQVGSQAYADRYTYVPHLGLFTFLIWETCACLGSQMPGRIIGSLLILLAVVSCADLTRQQIGFWKDAKSLWTHALRVDPHNDRANLLLAGAELADGEFEPAIEHAQTGIQFTRAKPMAYSYWVWGSALAGIDRNAEAEAKLRQALKINPKHVATLEALQKLMYRQGRQTEGDQFAQRMMRALAEDLQSKPFSAASQMLLGELELRRGDPQRAVVHYEQAVKLSPRNPMTHCNLGLARIWIQNYEGARTSFERAIELSPQLAVAHSGLADVLEFQNDLSGAKRHFAEAVRLDPSNDEYQMRLEQLTKKTQK